MPLEATMIIIDNSEYMRNGDYPPTRFDAQADAVNHIFTTKTDSNPENSVGLMSMAGKGPEVLVTNTRELGQIIQGVHTASMKLAGEVDYTTAINVAQLALKHRQNKNLRQRVIVFLGSPLQGAGTDEKTLVKLAKKLKKNNIAVDIVTFGDGIEEGETSVLRAFVDAVNSSDNSHLVSIPPDPRQLLSDAVLVSDILAADRGLRDEAMADITNTGAGPSGAGGFDDLGVDPTLDPELAMALRMSLEEDIARRAAQAQAQASASQSTDAPAAESTPASASASASIPPATDAAAAAVTGVTVGPASAATPALDDEEAELQQALALSRAAVGEEDVEMHDGDGAKDAASTGAGAGVEETMDEDEEAAITRAIQMSMQSEEEEKK